MNMEVEIRGLVSKYLPAGTMILATPEDIRAAFQAVYDGMPIPPDVVKRIGIIRPPVDADGG